MTLKRLKGIQIFWLLTGLLILLQIPLLASDIPQRPNPPRLVNDLAGILTPGERSTLEYKLRYFNDTTSDQIVVLTVNSLNGLQPYEFATEVGQKWGVGQKKFDNGVVILIKPKQGSSLGRAFIATGYGLEGAIPDATCENIVQNEMIPSFRKGNYYAGINKAVDVVMKLASGEISAKGYNKMHQKSVPYASAVPVIVFVLIWFLMRASNAHSYSVGNRGTSFWTALFLGSLLGGGWNRGHWNDFSGGSGFGGGGGFGGGFGGFGGGGFGGGGAGGSW